ncbi:hypothetical protein EVU97_05225 [Dermacoccus sp. 147Ba]|jgi:hypothetical protein|uniref:hypothetical protein n=1 Tax=Dermacoccus sp. 147Ba TaxID=2510111 RepID=UPI00101C0028|nr:hypothetical protein [Dermacoccus sp. 147Ba]RYI23116.1 hypothetical protein EVU97_05225 [Dermacoccus sp. 147Ba]
MKKIVASLYALLSASVVACGSPEAAVTDSPWSSVATGMSGDWGWRLVQSTKGEHRCLGLVAGRDGEVPSTKAAGRALAQPRKDDDVRASGSCSFVGTLSKTTTRDVKLELDDASTLSAGMVPAKAMTLLAGTVTTPTQPIVDIEGLPRARYWLAPNLDTSGTFDLQGADGAAVAFTTPL